MSAEQAPALLQSPPMRLLHGSPVVLLQLLLRTLLRQLARSYLLLNVHGGVPLAETSSQSSRICLATELPANEGMAFLPCLDLPKRTDVMDQAVQKYLQLVLRFLLRLEWMLIGIFVILLEMVSKIAPSENHLQQLLNHPKSNPYNLGLVRGLTFLSHLKV